MKTLEQLKASLSERLFPVMGGYYERRDHPDWPSWIPWGMVAAHEVQALRNHCDQPLEKLASRGGLDVWELYFVLNDKPWPWSEQAHGHIEAAYPYEKVRKFLDEAYVAWCKQ